MHVNPEQIKAARQLLGLSIRRVAEMAEVEQDAIRRIEKGDAVNAAVVVEVIETLLSQGVVFFHDGRVVKQKTFCRTNPTAPNGHACIWCDLCDRMSGKVNRHSEYLLRRGIANPWDSPVYKARLEAFLATFRNLPAHVREQIIAEKQARDEIEAAGNRVAITPALQLVEYVLMEGGTILPEGDQGFKVIGDSEEVRDALEGLELEVGEEYLAEATCEIRAAADLLQLARFAPPRDHASATAIRGG